MIRYDHGRLLCPLLSLPITAAGAYTLLSPLWLSRSELHSRGGPAMMIIVGIVFLGAGILATVTRRTVKLDPASRTVTVRYGVGLFPGRTYRLDQFSALALSRQLPSRQAGPNRVRTGPPRYILELRGAGNSIMLTSFRRPEEARQAAADLAPRLGIPVADSIPGASSTDNPRQ